MIDFRERKGERETERDRERERETERGREKFVVQPITHWLILVCALTGDQTSNLSILMVAIFNILA